jgi:fatty-acid desaturase
MGGIFGTAQVRSRPFALLRAFAFLGVHAMPEFGSLAFAWWVPVLYIVIVGHITNLCVTLYLHRSATHEGVKFHPIVESFMRTWLWLTTGIVTVEWVACHRKHHAFSDREGDPHSPTEEGLLAIVFGGVFFYREAVKDHDMLVKYSDLRQCHQWHWPRDRLSQFRNEGSQSKHHSARSLDCW